MRRRRGRIVALAVAGSVVVAWVATAIALAAGTNPGLSRMSPSEIVLTTVRAATAARTVHVDIEETTSLGQQTTLSSDVSPEGGAATETSGFADFTLVVVHHTIYVDGNVSYWVDVAPDVAVTVENRWVSLPADSSLIASQLLSLVLQSPLLQNLRLRGPLTQSGTGSPGDGTIVIHGAFPAEGFDPADAGAPAALTVATSPPYLPTRLDVQYPYGTISMKFSKWGEQVDPLAPSHASPLQSVDPLLTRVTAADAAAQADVQKALTGVEVYGSSNGGATNPVFAGLRSSSWATLDTGVAAVFGQPSDGPDQVSIDPQPRFAVMTAWAPAAGGSIGTCWGILDDDQGARVLGYRGPATAYFETPGRSYLDCSASRFAGSRPPTGVTSSTVGFNWLT